LRHAAGVEDVADDRDQLEIRIGFPQLQLELVVLGAASLVVACGAYLLKDLQPSMLPHRGAKPETPRKPTKNEYALKKELWELADGRAGTAQEEQASSLVPEVLKDYLLLRERVVDGEGAPVPDAWVALLEPTSALDDLGFFGFGGATAEPVLEPENRHTPLTLNSDAYCAVGHAASGQKGEFEFRLQPSQKRLFVYAIGPADDAYGTEAVLRPSTEEVLVILRSYMSLQCFVQSSEGHPIQGARIILNGERAKRKGTTDLHGRITFNDVVSGR